MSEKLFLPVNRHLRITVEKSESKTQSGVLLPDSFKSESDKYQKAKILSAASDCKDVFISNVGSEVYVEKSMIQEVTVSGMPVALILENYVIGVLP